MHAAHARYLTPEQNDGALIARYSHLIDRCARRLALRAGSAHLADDLWSAGAMGLIDAAKRFDAERAVKFETFAEHRIRGAMLDELRNLDHLPRRLRAKTDQVSKAKKKLSTTLGRDAAPDEVAHELGVTVEELGSLEQVGQPHVEIGPALKLVAADLPADEAAERKQRKERLTEAIATLPERLQMVLALYYVEEFTYREIGRLLEVSEARVCQLHNEAVGLLREEL